MALTISITGYVPPAGVPLTLAALRKLALGFSVSISGTVGSGEIVDGSVTPAKVSPGAYFYAGVATYSAGEYTCSLTPALSGYADGVRMYFKAGSINADGPITIRVNGLAARNIYKRNEQALFAGEITANMLVELTYNSSLNVGTGGWQLGTDFLFARRDFALATGTVTSHLCTDFAIATDWSYTDLSQVTARPFHFRLHADCAATPTFTPGTAAVKKAIQWLDGRAIAQSQLRQGMVVGVMYDSALDKYLVIGEQPSGVFAGVDSASSGTGWAVSLPGFPQAPVIGQGILLRSTIANTGPCTIVVASPAPNTFTASLAVKKFKDQALSAGDVKSLSWILLVWDGTNYVLSTPSAQPVVLAFANFDGTASTPITPRGSYNIDATAKVTKHGTGDYSLNFANVLPGVNYQVHITAGIDASSSSVQGYLHLPASLQVVGSVRFKTFRNSDLAAADSTYIYATVIGYP